MSEDAACELCGLPVGRRPFTLNTPTGHLQFCCEACRGIHEMLHDIGPGAPTGGETAPANPERKKP